ncbi:MAG: BrnT family toxin [Robiginitomaculum sp.]|nr:BrnT family toxin [Robiginitomaculum sp.]
MNLNSVVGFDWDIGNWPKCGKHGVSRPEIEAVFLANPDVYADPNHSLDEQRLRAIGQNKEGRYLLVAFTIRRKNDEWYIRPISARYMHKKEVKNYE